MNKKNVKGFPGSGDVGKEVKGDILKKGYRKIEADLDIHDKERNPKPSSDGKQVDVDNDYNGA